jgi:hypothetical protein
MNPPGSTPRPPPGARPVLSSVHRRERRALEVGLLASAVLHVLIIALYPLFEGWPGTGNRAAAEAPIAPTPEGTRIIQLIELAPEEISEPAPPERPQEERPSQPVAEVPPIAEPEPETRADAGPEEPEAPGRSVAERLRPRMVDPRLWAPLDRSYLELTDEERAQLLLNGMIRSWNDSVAVAAALAERASDWTYTDDEGRRWGLASGRLYLGTLSIPLPGIELASWQRQDAYSDRAWIQKDLAQGAAAQAVRETWVDRARAIRERLEAERSPADAGSGTARGGDDDPARP